ncbi:MAG: hypothetical protein IJ343_11615 [Clostridia bacterium]|nr:hypothetical protein [Clostridia bacterium]
MFEERYNRLMEGLEPSQELVKQTITEAGQRKPQTGAWKPVIVCMLCVMMVAGAALWRVMHTVAAHNQHASQPDDTAVLLQPSDDASERITVTPGTPYFIGENHPLFHPDQEGQLCFPFEVSGSGVNGSTCVYTDFPEYPGLINAGSSFQRDYSPESEGTVNAAIRMRLADGVSPESLTGTLTLLVNEVTLCSQHEAITHHDLLLSNVPKSREETRTVVQHYGRTVLEDGSYGPLHALDPQETQVLIPGDPFIELSGGMAVTAIGFEHKTGYLVVQVRIPLSLPEGSTCNVMLTPVEDGTGSSNGGWVHWHRERPWYDEANGYRYVEFIFMSANRSNYTNYSLRTFAHPIDEIITGPWILTYDLDAIENAD